MKKQIFMGYNLSCQGKDRYYNLNYIYAEDHIDGHMAIYLPPTNTDDIEDVVVES